MLVPARPRTMRVLRALAVLVATLAVPSTAAAAVQPCTPPVGTHAAPQFATAHPHVLVDNAATLTCLQNLLAQNAPSAVRFKALVDGELTASTKPGYVWGDPQSYLFQAWYAALMFQVTGQTKYSDFAIKFSDAVVSGEEAKITAGQTPEVAGDDYLDVGPMVGDIALTYDWDYARLTPDQRSRWIAYMNQAVSNVWNPDTASWGGKAAPWSGWSIDNPSDNYYYSFLRATMLLGLATRGENPQAQTWLDEFRTAKFGNELIPTFTTDLVGGGSREGTGYGIAMKGLFELEDWWERSTGERIADLTPHAEDSLAWMTNAIVPTLDQIAAVGDQSRDSSASLFDYHREYLLTLMSLFPQDRASTIAGDVLAASSVPEMQNGFEAFADYLYQPPTLPTASLSDYSTTYYGSGSGLLFMRSAWGDPKAAFSEFSCGPYTESHAHQDQGAFQIFRGEWLAPTGNIYTHSGIQQGTAFNNLVRLQTAAGADIPQVPGDGHACHLTALASTPQYTDASADVTAAYAGNAAVKKVQREYLFIKPSTFVVFDRVQTTAGTKRIFTLNLPGTPTVVGDHLTYTGKKSASDRLDVYGVAPNGITPSVSDPDYADGDEALPDTTAQRVDETDTAGTESDFLHVIGTSTDGTDAVSGVTSDDVSGQTGVSFTLADGRTVVARFDDATTGGTLSIQDGATSQVSGALPATVVDPPVFATAATDTGSTGAPAGPGAGGTTGGDGSGSGASPTATPTPTSSPGASNGGAGGAPSAPPGTSIVGPGGTLTAQTWLASYLAVAPRRTKRSGLAVLRIVAQPTHAGACPKTGTVTIAVGRARLRRAVVRLATQRYSPTVAVCVSTTAAVRTPSTQKSITVTLGGKGLHTRRWTLKRP